MKTLNKVVTIFAKIGEVCCWVLCAFMLACTIVVAAGKMEWLNFFGTFDVNAPLLELEALGFSVEATSHHAGVYIMFFIATLFSGALWAMICRNVYLIFKTSIGKTKFSKGATPFQPDNIRMVREIGIFMIAVPIVQLIISIIAALFLSHETVDAVTNGMGVFPGLVVLCLSQYFAYGANLEHDAEGLI